jgi:hypothetical protein
MDVCVGTQQIRLMDHVQIWDTPAFPLSPQNAETDLIALNLVRVHDLKHPVDAGMCCAVLCCAVLCAVLRAAVM